MKRKEDIAIGSRVNVYTKTGQHIGFGKVTEHEPICSGFVKGFIAFVRMDNGRALRVPFIPPADVELVVLDMEKSNEA